MQEIFYLHVTSFLPRLTPLIVSTIQIREGEQQGLECRKIAFKGKIFDAHLLIVKQ